VTEPTPNAAAHPDPVITALFARRSQPRLIDPGPTPEEVNLLVAAACAAPDHGEARPWRFVVFRDEDRVRFGEVLAESARHLAADRGETLDEARLDKERRRFLRAPVVIAVLCRTQQRRVLPAEQRDAVAAATQNLLLAAGALGYGSVWRTGEAATSPIVHEAFGLGPDDAVMGFIYLGTVPDGEARPPRRHDTTPWIEPAPG
jgi:nitroreductase